MLLRYFVYYSLSYFIYTTTSINISIPIQIVDSDTLDYSTSIKTFKYQENNMLHIEVENFCMTYKLMDSSCQALLLIAQKQLSEFYSSYTMHHVAIFIEKRSDILCTVEVMRFLKMNWFSNLKIIVVSTCHSQSIDFLYKSMEIELPTIQLNWKFSYKNQDNHYPIPNAIQDLSAILIENTIEYLIVVGASKTATIGALSGYYLNISTIIQIVTSHQPSDYCNNCEFDKQFGDQQTINNNIIQAIATHYIVENQILTSKLLKRGILNSAIITTGSLLINSLINTLKLSGHRVNRLSEVNKNIYNNLNISVSSWNIIIYITNKYQHIHKSNLIILLKSINKLAKHYPNFTFLFIELMELQFEISNLKTLLPDFPSNVKIVHQLPYPLFLCYLEYSSLAVTNSLALVQETSFLGIPTLLLQLDVYTSIENILNSNNKLHFVCHNSSILNVESLLADGTPNVNKPPVTAGVTGFDIISRSKNSYDSSSIMSSCHNNTINIILVEMNKLYDVAHLLLSSNKLQQQLAKHSIFMGDGSAVRRASCFLLKLFQNINTYNLCIDNNNNNNISYLNLTDFEPLQEMSVLENALKADVTVNYHLYLQDQLPDESQSLTDAENNNNKDIELLKTIKIAKNASVTATPTSLFCGIYTTASRHSTNIEAIRTTWGKRCNGWLAFSTENNETIPAINIIHEGEEKYTNMWQKSRSIWKYIYRHFYDDYDWFLLGGDDVYFIIENLRYFLSSEEIINEKENKNGMYLGRRVHRRSQYIYHTGESGYILDRKALKILAANLDSNICGAHQTVSWEDAAVARCLFLSGGVEPRHCTDSYGKEIFHYTSPELMSTESINEWYFEDPKDAGIKGLDCCSEYSVSFHNLKADRMREVHSFLYHNNRVLRENKTRLGS